MSEQEPPQPPEPPIQHPGPLQPILSDLEQHDSELEALKRVTEDHSARLLRDEQFSLALGKELRNLQDRVAALDERLRWFEAREERMGTKPRNCGSCGAIVRTINGKCLRCGYMNPPMER